MLLYFKTKICIQIEHPNIKLILNTYLVFLISMIPDVDFRLQVITWQGEYGQCEGRKWSLARQHLART